MIKFIRIKIIFTYSMLLFSQSWRAFKGIVFSLLFGVGSDESGVTLGVLINL